MNNFDSRLFLVDTYSHHSKSIKKIKKQKGDSKIKSLTNT